MQQYPAFDYCGKSNTKFRYLNPVPRYWCMTLVGGKTLPVTHVLLMLRFRYDSGYSGLTRIQKLWSFIYAHVEW
jgi:hypothetical protein